MLDVIHSALGFVNQTNDRLEIVAHSGESGWLLFGPYVDLPVGTYAVAFGIAADKPSAALCSSETCCHVDVCLDNGHKVLVSLALSPNDLVAAEGKVTLKFTTESPGCFEFRVFATGSTALRIQAARTLTMDGDYLGLATGIASSQPAPSGFVCNEFLLRHMAHFRMLVAHGAHIEPAGQGAIVTLRGSRVNIRNSEDFQILQEIFIHNEYNFAVSGSVCIVDIGMNIGLASLFFAQIPSVQEIHAFEPFRQPFERALENFRLNPSLGRKISPYCYGLSDRNEIITVLSDDSKSISVSTLGLAEGVPSAIEIRNAADVLSGIIMHAQERGLEVVIKMDCEGSEFAIIQSLADQDLLSDISMFLIEWHKWWSSEKSQWDLITPLLRENFAIFDQTSLANPHAGSLYAVRRQVDNCTTKEAVKPMLEQKEIVTSLYQGLLQRDPDAGGLTMFTDKLRNGMDLSEIVRDFVQSDEFRVRFGSPSHTFPLDSAPAMSVTTSYTAAEAEALWDHIANVWSGFGDNDPYYSVLTDERWRMSNMSRDDTMAAFYETGEGELRRLDAWLARNKIEIPSDAVCAELGCGVGRITRSLAKRFRRVVAFDISRPHIDAARGHLTREGIQNVDYRLLRGADDLNMLADVDVFYSILVLQHNPPPIMLEILKHAFASLRPGGVAFFQIPTYSSDYSFTVQRYFETVALAEEMEMHFLPQNSILDLGHRLQMVPIEIQPDWCIGNWERAISTTFLLRKSA